MSTWIALLRAINVGTHNQVTMPGLRAALTASGLTDVRSYLQSGNLAFESAHERPGQVAAHVRAVLATEFGWDVPVVVRTPGQVAEVVAANPFPVAARDRPKQLHVVFLDGEPVAGMVERLAAEVPTTVCQVRGDAMYVDYAEGVHGSRLTPQFFARRLGVAGTARNWRTVLALLELAAASGS